MHEGDTVEHGSEDNGQGGAGGTSGAAETTIALATAGAFAPAAAGPAVRVNGQRTQTQPPVAPTVAAMPLQSLTPSYDEGHHGTYLRRLEEAVRNPQNLNIALTGRYGAGKSSVLDRFQANHRKTTQRLAISTLAPGEDGQSTTNRIQKEIVKQLLYGASEKVGKNSRFSKIAVLSKRKAFIQSAAIVACVAGLLYLLGWLPNIKWTGPDHATWVRTAAWTGAALLATLVVSVVRMLTYGRFLSDVSAGGATLTLAEKPESFFDKYLDEIVHYFGRESKDIVVFEDLDRFEDPHIFEALRELNILLNATPERRATEPGPTLRWLLARLPEDAPAKLAAKLPYRWVSRLLGLGVPLRFVYAVRDSVFEKIDATPACTATRSTDGAGGAPAGLARDAGAPAAADMPTAPAAKVDAAVAETLRANRTKFFDIVIPLVPFISHRNARDLLLKLLAERGIVGIERRLVNTIAQHCTDMRLMHNMCNEYLVFAERLLEPETPNKTAPGLDASHLFALVAYKNFHLEDFENITRRDSDLDRLYQLHQRLVRETIAAKEAQKRALLKAPEAARTQAGLAQRLGTRLARHADAERRASAYRDWSFTQFRVGSNEFTGDDLTSYSFWSAVAQARSITVLAATSEAGGQTRPFLTLDSDALAVLVPEGLDAHRWAEYDANATEFTLVQIDRDIEDLRRADFAELVTMTRFTLTGNPAGPGTANPAAPGTASPAAPGTAIPALGTFAQRTTAILKSELACDLVRRGYIDRNFSLYAAEFYGRFTGVDVANFMVQHVQTNTMAVDYDLSRPGAVANLLAETEEAGDEIEHTVAAYNIDIVNHLLATNDPRAGDIADGLIAGWAGQDSRTFLAAYFTSDSAEREKFVAVLAKHRWRQVFTYLVTAEDVPANARPALVGAAMCAFDRHATYDLGDEVREFITANYRNIRAFSEEHPVDASVPPAERLAERLDVMLERAGVVIPRLDEVRDVRLRELVVAANRYDLTADNLRSALGITGEVSLDQVQRTDTVYRYCLNEPVSYLVAVGQDAATRHSVNTRKALVKLLNDVAERWEEEQDAEPDADNLADLLAAAAPNARLSSLRAVPESTWTALAAAHLFRPSLANVEDYRAHAGCIDTHLAEVLEGVGTIHVDGPDDTRNKDGNEYDRRAAAIAILNASELTPPVRVDLAASLDPPAPLPVDVIEPAADNLFALLLERGMVVDDETSFTHFRDGGWGAIGPAIQASNKITTFVKPDLVLGMVADLLVDPTTSAKLGPIVVDDVGEYVPDDDWDELKAVARYADAYGVQLMPDTVVRIARVGRENGELSVPLMLRLLSAASPVASADHIVEVFSRLGKPYSDISQSGAKFRVGRDEIHDQLLMVLKDAGRITRRTGRGQYSITVI